ncbi:hypothetical protein TVAG_159520 [Trichomonas vaginalis G3]|uniref:Uncharacterized protein n=1 Tax=Trichomonas vaginalis (strain ATCC PRA-98 / G3) TaxID=412133 RepID=A2F5A7_TRIV3|nr:hypothetical protein TVAGG3_0159920 [Trichomonas vaginalis G3]EAX99932.1 hypothetical protein TVAG_159520 [Trichomonas vaginalis G3]KAI5547787.1 hypothetical protein TVAGG3_0159920 [Trichomonas vaginalis G3]|eukprot:XP_001312862.1 hypothetical protein [Trichomonas vaginalis G3]
MSFLSSASGDEWEGNKPDVKEVSESTLRQFREKFENVQNENNLLKQNLENQIKKYNETKEEKKLLLAELKRVAKEYENAIAKAENIEKLINAEPPKKEAPVAADKEIRVQMSQIKALEKEINFKQTKIKEVRELLDNSQERWKSENTRLQQEYESLMKQNDLIKSQIELFTTEFTE